MLPTTSLTSVAYVLVLPDLKSGTSPPGVVANVEEGNCGVAVVGAVQVFPPSELEYESNARTNGVA